MPFLQLREESNLPPSPPLESPEPFPCSVRHKDIAGNTNKWWLSGAGILQDDIPLGRLTEMTEWMCQPMMPQEMGLLPRSWWAKQEPVPSSSKKNGKLSATTLGRKARLAGVSAAASASFLFSNYGLPA